MLIALLWTGCFDVRLERSESAAPDTSTDAAIVAPPENTTSVDDDAAPPVEGSERPAIVPPTDAQQEPSQQETLSEPPSAEASTGAEAVEAGAAFPMAPWVVPTDLDANLPTAPDSASIVATMDGGADAPDACVPAVANPAVGVFVSPRGAATDDCGTVDAPCDTISRGVTLATANGRSIVYIEQGVYPEHVIVHKPISLLGGWQQTNDQWTRDCGRLANTTRIDSPSNVGLLAQYDGRALLQALTIRTKERETVANGESKYGAFVSGVDTHLELLDVVVQARGANDGHGGTDGMATQNPDCRAGTGADGNPGPSTETTSPGRFTYDRYVPGNGSTGLDGQPGQGGSDAPTRTAYCFSACYGSTNTCDQLTVQVAGGGHGCGGGAGTGGTGGGGGGASVGLFAEGSVQLHEAVVLIAGNGGDGGKGGRGGTGQPGTDGTEGGSAYCNLSCCINDSYTFYGERGTDGGHGGSGANGGDGSGGWSIALVGSFGSVTGITNATLVAGTPGVSAGSGPAGSAAGFLELGN